VSLGEILPAENARSPGAVITIAPRFAVGVETLERSDDLVAHRTVPRIEAVGRFSVIRPLVSAVSSKSAAVIVIASR
jgi:hypothetical protein